MRTDDSMKNVPARFKDDLGKRSGCSAVIVGAKFSLFISFLFHQGFSYF
jgi:hypothetical protein